MRVLLVAGGWSPEREISLMGASIIREALAQNGHEVAFYDLNCGFQGLLDAARHADKAFLNLHGAPGEDGLVQALLESAGCPYQGGGPKSCFLALHKSAAAEVFRSAGLKTPRGVFLPSMPVPGWRPPFGFPVFVKPDTGGSSIGMSRVTEAERLFEALRHCGGKDMRVEELVSGAELTCGIVEIPRSCRLDPPPDFSECTVEHHGSFIRVAMPPILIVPRGEFFDFADKYDSEGAREICPAPISRDVRQDIQKAALTAHAALGLKDYSRADFIVPEDGDPVILEVNTLPGMTAASLVPKEAAAMGVTYAALLDILLSD